MKRILMLALLTSLKVVIILANSIHTCLLCICKVIADVFQLPTADLLNGSPTEDSMISPINGITTNHSMSTQTEDEFNQQENSMKKTGTNVHIYNLNSTQKLVLSQGTPKRRKYEHSKSATVTAERNEDLISTAGLKNLSYMSIESDVIDSKIESCCSTSNNSNSSNLRASLNAEKSKKNSLLVDTANSNDKINSALNCHNNALEDSSIFSNECLNDSNDTYSISTDTDYFECLKNSAMDDTNACGGATLHSKKTSSPLKTSLNPLYTKMSMFNANHRTETTNFNDVETEVGSDYWKKDALRRDVKRRLSLPVKLNTTDISVTNFKQAQQKLIEETLKNTSRHEKSFKEIKYPFASDISLDSKPNDEVEDKVFSCSSYESLPVSDHLRNAFDKNTIFNLYSESSHAEEPDFSCIDSIVDSFNDIKSALSEEKVESKINASVASEENDYISFEKNKNLAQNAIYESPLESKVSKDYLKKAHNFLFSKESSNGEMSNCASELRSSTNIRDVCELLDKFLDSETKFVSERFSRICGEDTMKNDLLDFDVNCENQERLEFDMNENDSKYSTEKEKFNCSNIKLEDEKDANIYEPNQIKHSNSANSSKSMSDIFEIDSDVQVDFENIASNTKQGEGKKKSYYGDCLDHNDQKSYNKIAFIAESPPTEMNSSSEIKSEISPRDSLLIDEKPKHYKKDILRHFRGEIDTLVQYDSPANYLQQKDIANESENYESKSLEVKSAFSENQQILPPFTDQRIEKETSSANQCISETNCQYNCVNDQKSAFLPKITKRNQQSNKSSNNHSVSPKLSPEKPFLEPNLSFDENKTCQNISEKRLENHSLNEDEKPMLFEEPISSGSSLSDNSDETVKDLIVVGDENEDNDPSKNGC